MPQQTPIPSLTPWKVFIRTSLICMVLGVVVFGLTLKRIENLPLSGTPLHFDAAQAHSYMTQLSKGFPNRVTWSDSRRRAGAWLKSELQKLGYEPKGMFFSEVIAGKQYTDLENIYAEKRGLRNPNEIIVVTAHYDITDTTTEGAMDDASGVGVVLELARVFAKENTDRTIVFLLTDSEEFGALWGARAFARNYEHTDQIVAVASFDFVGTGVQSKILTLCDGLKGGFTPLWLRELALDSLRARGNFAVLDMTNFMEFIMRAVQIPAADHGAFLSAGIPAFNWVGQEDNFAFQMGHYHHTKDDVAEAIKVDSFRNYGLAAEQLVRSVNELARIPEDFRNSSYWKVTHRLYLDGWAVTILHILAFIPFLAYCIAKFGSTVRRHSRERILRVFKNEAKNIGILMGSLLLGYVVMLLLPALKIVTQYEAFPATQKSQILYNPNFVAMLLVLLSIVGVYWLLSHTFSEPEDSVAYADTRHAVHAAFLAFIIFLAFLKNSYLATLLLLPPAYFWMGIRARRKTETRIFNALLLLGGSLTLIVTTLVMGTVFYIGVPYWYIFLSATYGLISAYTVVLFFMALTIMIRLFRSFVFK